MIPKQGNKMRKLIFPFIVALCCGGADCSDDPDPGTCQSDYDCASWQECSAGLCVDRPEGSCEYNLDCGFEEECSGGRCVPLPPGPDYPSGYVTQGCNCSTTSLYPGQELNNSNCASGREVVVACNYCCATDFYGNCVGFAWGMVCR